MAPGPAVGDRAPNFTLHQTRYETVSLDELLGQDKVVLLFYFMDWSGA